MSDDPKNKTQDTAELERAKLERLGRLLLRDADDLVDRVQAFAGAPYTRERLEALARVLGGVLPDAMTLCWELGLWPATGEK